MDYVYAPEDRAFADAAGFVGKCFFGSFYKFETRTQFIRKDVSTKLMTRQLLAFNTL